MKAVVLMGYLQTSPYATDESFVAMRLAFVHDSLFPLSAILLSILVMFILLRRKKEGRVYTLFQLFNLSILSWSLSILFRQNLPLWLDPGSPSYHRAFYWLVFFTLLSASSVVCHWFLLAAAFSRRIEWTRGWRRGIAYVPALWVAIFWSNESLSRFFFRDIEGKIAGIGPAFWVFLPMALCLMVVPIRWYVGTAWQSREARYKKQATVMVVGSFMPIVAGVVFTVRQLAGAPHNMNYTALFLALTNAIFAYALLRTGWLDLLPIAVREVFLSMADAVVVLGVDDRIAQGNPAALRALPGVKPGDSLAAHAPEIAGCIERCRRAGPNEFECRHADTAYWGRIIDIRAQNEVAGSLLILTDVTERKRAEEAMRESEERYRDLFENAMDAAYTHTLSGQFTSINKAGEQLLGYSRRDLLNMKLDQVVAPNCLHVSRQIGKMLLAGEKNLIHELDVLTQDGRKVPIELNVRLMHEEGKVSGVQGMARDVTERKRAEQETQRAREAAEAASRAKSEFLANMSHEIRTPMNGIVGMTELALTTDVTPEQRDYLEMVRSSSDSLLTIINDILDFSRIEAGKLDLEVSEFNLRDCLEDTLQSLGVRASQKGLTLSCRTDPRVPVRIAGDANRLRQIIVNLVGNAIKFTDIGGITVKVEADAMGASEAAISFEVKDTGIGIPKEKQRLIFEAFAQADGSTTRKYGGTGLGLAISSQLVGLMGGRLSVESEPGRGSAFRFTARFAICSEPAARESTSSVSANAIPSKRTPAGRGLNILLAEDNRVNQRLAVLSLERRGHKVVVAENGRQSLDYFDRERFDLVLMDVQMPEMNGLEATSAIRERERVTGAHIPIIAMTACAIKGDRERCLEAGMDGYISKPVKPDELYRAIEELSQANGHFAEADSTRILSLAGTQPV